MYDAEVNDLSAATDRFFQLNSIHCSGYLEHKLLFIDMMPEGACEGDNHNLFSRY